MAAQPHLRFRQLGFTLIELMVVMILIAIMAVMIIPEMRGTFSDALLRSSSRELVNVFSLANSRAITLNTEQRVRLDPRTGRYLIEQKLEASDQVGGPSGFVPARDVPGGNGTIDKRIAVEFRRSDATRPAEPEPASATQETDEDQSALPGEVIGFYPDGTTDGGEIVLKDPQGYQRILQINPITSRIQILEKEPEGSP